MNTSLLVFAKVPRPGAVKTRLTPALSSDDAARLYTAFLRDTLRQVSELGVDVRLYLAPPFSKDAIDGLPTGVSLHKQRGEGLGARMKHAFEDTFAEGAHRVVGMGSDHPTLPTSFLRQAVQSLDSPPSLCIGPSEDGGFYLIGMTAAYQALFDGMTYSHAQVFSDTLARAEQIDAQVTVLPQWYDVDTPQDLHRMLADLSSGPAEAPNTRRMVGRLNLDARAENRTSGSR